MGSGYASNFLQTPGEEGQIWIGGGYGLNIRTNTESNICFQTGGYTTPNSMTILGFGNRDVEIHTPLSVKGTSTTIEKSVTIGTTMATSTTGLTVNNACSFGGAVTVTGALTTNSFYAIKPWIALRYSGTITPAGSPGFNQSGITINNSAVGTYAFTIPAHPSGTNYMVFVQQIASGGTTSATALANYNVLVNNATTFTVYSKTTSSVVIASNFYVYTVP